MCELSIRLAFSSRFDQDTKAARLEGRRRGGSWNMMVIRSHHGAALTWRGGEPQMARNHGARQQKRLAKQKAKRSAKRSIMQKRSSSDPNVRLQGAEKWPVVESRVSAQLWTDGIGHLVLARLEPSGQLIIAVLLVDVFCLGVKNAFWQAGTRQEFEDLVERIEETGELRPIAPGCLATIVTGAVEYAESFGFLPHPDYRHASKVLAGIDPEACPQQFTFGHDGKPCYMQGPYESPAEARAIMERVAEAGGHYMIGIRADGAAEFPGFGHELDEFDSADEEERPAIKRELAPVDAPDGSP
jgi:hypothetical protein